MDYIKKIVETYNKINSQRIQEENYLLKTIKSNTTAINVPFLNYKAGYIKGMEKALEIIEQEIGLTKKEERKVDIDINVNIEGE